MQERAIADLSGGDALGGDEAIRGVVGADGKEVGVPEFCFSLPTTLLESRSTSVLGIGVGAVPPNLPEPRVSR